MNVESEFSALYRKGYMYLVQYVQARFGLCSSASISEELPKAVGSLTGPAHQECLAGLCHQPSVSKATHNDLMTASSLCQRAHKCAAATSNLCTERVSSSPTRTKVHQGCLDGACCSFEIKQQNRSDKMHVLYVSAFSVLPPLPLNTLQQQINA
jgi:hypothetical protein